MHHLVLIAIDGKDANRMSRRMIYDKIQMYRIIRTNKSNQLRYKAGKHMQARQ